MITYEYQGFTVHAWTEIFHGEIKGLATITGRALDGRMSVKTYLSPFQCSSEKACEERMREDINASIDKGTVFGPLGSG